MEIELLQGLWCRRRVRFRVKLLRYVLELADIFRHRQKKDIQE